jgi:hypothetical protein
VMPLHGFVVTRGGADAQLLLGDLLLTAFACGATCTGCRSSSAPP